MGDAPARQWSGDVVLRPGLLAFTGRIGPAGLHAHHTVGVNIALGGTVVLADADGRTTTATAFVVPADVAHRVVRGTGTGIVAQVEPLSRAGRVLTAMVTDPGSVEAWAAAGAALHRRIRGRWRRPPRPGRRIRRWPGRSGCWRSGRARVRSR